MSGRPEEKPKPTRRVARHDFRVETFVVRIWQPAGDEYDDGLHGTVEYVRSANSRPFSGRDELMRIIETELSTSQR
jgi:hypothetical protein